LHLARQFERGGLAGPVLAGEGAGYQGQGLIARRLNQPSIRGRADGILFPGVVEVLESGAGLGAGTGRPQAVGATQAAVHARIVEGAGGVGCCRLKSLEGLGAADLAQGAGGGGGDIGFGIGQQFRQGGDGARFAAVADGIDDPGLRQSARAGQGFDQRPPGLAGAHGFQGVAGRVRELLVGQQRGEGRDGAIGADAFELGAGGIFFRRRRIRPQNADEARFFRGGGGEGGGPGAGKQQAQRQKEERGGFHAWIGEAESQRPAGGNLIH